MTLTIAVFITIEIKLFNLRFLFGSLAKTDSFRFFRKFLNIVSLAMAFTGLYTKKINYKYLKWIVYSNIKLLLILKNIFELAKNVVSKNSINFKIFLEKILKFFLCYQIFGPRATFLLILLFKLLLCREIKWQKSFDLACWP